MRLARLKKEKRANKNDCVNKCANINSSRTKSNGVVKAGGSGAARAKSCGESIRFFRLTVLFLLVVIVVTLVYFSVKRVKIYAGFKACYGTVVNRCNEFNLQPELVFAIIYAESGFNRFAKSDKGACGLMQIMPKTASYAADLSGYSEKIDLFNPNCNIYLGCVYLNYLFKRFENEKNVVCAYNAGEGRVLAWLSEQYLGSERGEVSNEKSKNGGLNYEVLELRMIPFRETSEYYARVCDYKLKFRRILKRRGAKNKCKILKNIKIKDKKAFC